jgi:tetratricopeptide (TPR) repeat protein
MAAGKTIRRKQASRIRRPRQLGEVRGALWTNLPPVAPESLPGLRADVDQARQEYRFGHYEDAERVLLRPLRALPGMIDQQGEDRPAAGVTYASAWAVLARTREKLGHDQQAAAGFERARRLFAHHLPGHADASGEEWGDYGVTLERLGDRADALSAFRRALALGLHTSEVCRHIGLVLRASDRQEATIWLRQSTELAPEDPYALSVLAEHLEQEAPNEAQDLFRDAAFAAASRSNIDAALHLYDRALELGPDDPNALAGKAEMLRLLDACVQAVELFERSLALVPDVPWVVAGHAAALHRLGHDVEALELLDKTLERVPEFLFAIGTKARVLRAMGKPDESAELLAGVEVTDPSAAWILVERAESLRALGDNPTALDELNEALQLMPRDADAHVIRAAAHLALREGDAALSDVRTALRLEQDSPFALGVLGQILYERGSFLDAADALHKAFDLAPGQAWYAATWGEALRMAGQWDEALVALDAALEVDPSHAVALASKADVLGVLGRYKDALDALDEALRLERGRYPFALSLKGRLLRETGESDEAEACLRQSLELDAEQPVTLAELAEVVLIDGRMDEALALSERALAIAPELVPALLARARVLRSAGQDEQAVALLRRAIELDGGEAWIRAELGDTLLTLDRPDEALRSLDEALEMQPDNLFALATKGQALRRLMRLDEALACLQAAIDRGADAPWVLTEWGEALRMSGRHTEALQAFDRALAVDSGNPWALAGRGSVLHAMQQYPAAFDAFDRALALVRMPFVLEAKAAALIDVGDYEEAIRLLDEDLAMGASDAWVLRMKGWAAECALDAETALAAYEAALEEEPGSMWSVRGVAEARLMMGHHRRARAGFRRVVKHSITADTAAPSEAAVVGWAYLRLAQLDPDASEPNHDLALRYLGHALAIEDEVVSIQLDIALALMSAGDYRRGVRAYLRGVGAAQSLPPLRRRAVLNIARNDIDDAKRLLEHLVTAPETREILAVLDAAIARSEEDAGEEDVRWRESQQELDRTEEPAAT